MIYINDEVNSYTIVMNMIRSRTTSHVYKLYAHEYAVSDDNVYKPAWRASILATRNYVVTGSNMLPVKWLSTCEQSVEPVCCQFSGSYRNGSLVFIITK